MDIEGMIDSVLDTFDFSEAKRRRIRYRALEWAREFYNKLLGIIQGYMQVYRKC